MIAQQTSREVVQLHTIDQWMAIDRPVRAEILRHIKLKDRLQRYLQNLNNKVPSPLSEPKWVPCKSCETRGWVAIHPRYPGIHPSQISQPCLLKIYYEMVGKDGKQNVEPRLRLVFDLGHAVHNMFQNYGEDGAWGPVYAREVPVNGDVSELARELFIEGHADADNILVVDDIPNAPIFEVGIVHEYKTINSNGFNRLKSAKSEHQVQAGIYSAVLNRPVVVFLYLNKDTSQIIDFTVEHDPAKWAKTEAKCRTLKAFYERGQPPEGSPGFHCQSCGFVYDCPAAEAAQMRR